MNPITKARISQNLTQQQLADRLGVNIRTVQRWEARKGKIPMRIMLLLSVLLVACGSEPKEETNDLSAKTFETEADIYPCAQQNENEIVYVCSQKSYKVCNSGQWLDP